MAHPETVPETNDIETVAPARVGDTLGYARVSTHDQNPDAQSDRLIEAGAIRVFTDIVSGKRFDRRGTWAAGEQAGGHSDQNFGPGSEDGGGN